MSTTSRERDLVELVDPAGYATGSATVAVAHRSPGMLHRAYSVVLFSEDGRILLQQRAAVKTRFALRWGNSCCGHPPPGTEVTAAARQRVAEELGADGVPLAEAGVYVYRADDPATSRVEHEYDHVLVGRLGPQQRLSPDPAEVAQLEWVELEWLRADLRSRPDRYAPWLAGVLAQLGTAPAATG